MVKNKKKRYYLIFALFSVVFCILPNPAEADDAAPVSEENKEVLKSLTSDRRETLAFGIDSEVISLLEKLREEGDDKFADDVLEIFERTLNSKMRTACVEYFIKIEYEGAAQAAGRILDNWEDEERDSISAAVRYLSNYPDSDTEDKLALLIDNDDIPMAVSALTAIGRCGTEKSAGLILDYLESDDFDDKLVPSAIKALGEIGSESAVEFLTEILEDEGEEKSWRWNAAEALGKIGKPESLQVLKNTMSENDPYLRSYAVKALLTYDGSEVDKILMESLRDSFWRVRTSSAEALGERKTSEAVDILIYKAGKDPEDNVRKAAIRALGEIGEKKGYDYLRTVMSDEKQSPKMRVEAAEVLFEKDIKASADDIRAVLQKEWDKDNSAVLGHFCRLLSTYELAGMADFFEKMLDHKDVAIRIYGIRGININRIGNLKEKIADISKNEKENVSVKKEALAVLETW